MMTTLALKTNNDPLLSVRRFLQKIWATVGLESMIIPVYQRERMTVQSALIDNPDYLLDADPFAPLMQTNAGRMVAQLAKIHTHPHKAAVLRACEIRALDEYVRREGLNLENWLIIAVDCVACFPAQDFDWRVEKAGNVEMLTRQVLRNARQGGIAPYRFRSACQMCSGPEPSHVDMCIQLLGLPVKETLLVAVKNQVIADELDLRNATDGPAPAALINQRERMLEKIETRRRKVREWKIAQLPPDMPANIEQLTHFLMNCQPCTACMAACPVHADELVPAAKNGTLTHKMVTRWLQSCAECGMCEQACPKGIPLAAIMDRITPILNVPETFRVLT